ncbi:polyprenyl synthetase family protein [Candidatus Aerophobetes bacterium]|nr:polyprenyl synthetase family protein [Candidatus Aerophobetes bacterium]
MTHLLGSPGKRIRPALIILCLKASGSWNPKAIPVASAIEIIHTATLVHDDILDEADLRRDQITINAGWGNEMALLLGDYLYFKAFSLLSRVNEEKISEVVSATAQRICGGEISQTRRSFDVTVNEEEYLEIIACKTASFMAACCQIGGILARSPLSIEKALIGYGLNFGMAFQILDDCLDFFSSPEKTGKTLGKDIQQGKLTFPLIYLRKTSQVEGNKIDLSKLFSQKEQALALLKEYRITQVCVKKIKSFLNVAEENLGILKPSFAKNSLELIVKYLGEKSVGILSADKPDIAKL